MYSGHMLEELVRMVARAEEHARDTRIDEPEVRTIAMYVPAYTYEMQNQQVFMGAV